MNEFISLIIGAIGGVAGLFTVVKFFSKTLVEIALKNVDLRNSKQLEELRFTLGNKTYISKVRFDAEFQIYRDVSANFFYVLTAISEIIPPEYTQLSYACYSKDTINKKAHEVTRAFERARDTIHKNAPFMKNDIYERYDKIVDLLNVQEQKIGAHYQYHVNGNCKFKSNSKFTQEDCQLTSDIIECYKEVTNVLRQYFDSLEVYT